MKLVKAFYITLISPVSLFHVLLLLSPPSLCEYLCFKGIYLPCFSPFSFILMMHLATRTHRALPLTCTQTFTPIWFYFLQHVSSPADRFTVWAVKWITANAVIIPWHNASHKMMQNLKRFIKRNTKWIHMNVGHSRDLRRKAALLFSSKVVSTLKEKQKEKSELPQQAQSRAAHAPLQRIHTFTHTSPTCRNASCLLAPVRIRNFSSSFFRNPETKWWWKRLSLRRTIYGLKSMQALRCNRATLETTRIYLQVSSTV